jgi:hypothetical protein
MLQERFKKVKYQKCGERPYLTQGSGGLERTEEKSKALSHIETQRSQRKGCLFWLKNPEGSEALRETFLWFQTGFLMDGGDRRKSQNRYLTQSSQSPHRGMPVRFLPFPQTP